MPFIKHVTPTASAAPETGSLDAHTAGLALPLATQRRAAADALGDWPQAAPLLLAALHTEPDQSVRSAMLGALARIASPDAVSGLADCLRSEEPWLRLSAIEVLRGLPQNVPEVIERLLVDPERDVRILAIGILDSLRHARVEHWLLQLIDTDADVNVCGTAIDLLAEVGTGRALAPVTRLLARFPDEPYIAFAAKVVLQRIETEA